jgi:uncharacterized damage-inducible protein DinB
MSEPKASPRGIEARLALERRSLLEAIQENVKSPLQLPPDRRMPLSRIALFAQLEEVRDDWKEIRARVDRAAAGRFINAGWTLKDLLAHMASWAREFRSEVTKVSRQESFDYVIPFAMSVFGPTQWNEVEVAARRDRTLEQIFEEFDEETGRLQDVVLELDEAVLYGSHEFPIAPSGDPSTLLRAPAAFILMAKCQHDRYHLGQIRARLKRLLE